ALLSLDEDAAQKPAKPAQNDASVNRILDKLSQIAFTTLTHPSVFISESILTAYVRLQVLLQRPATLPKIFQLYATKPIPESGSSPIRYSTPISKRAKYAVPANLANLALQSTIGAKNLPQAMSIVDTTF